MQRNMNKITFC